jgi:LacI family transcriptional regulator
MSGQNNQVTMQDIAARAEVSLSTVSRVLSGSARVSEKKRAAVRAAVEALNYRPNIFAQGLVKGESRTVGVLTQYISAPVLDAILHGILGGLRGSGYSPLFADGYWQPARERKSIQLLLERQVDGLIVLWGATPDAHLREVAQQVPLVVIGRRLEGLEAHCIRIDDFMGAYRATEHLIGLGHRQIAHIAGIMERDDAQQRHYGYCRALEDAGLPVDETLIIEGNYVEQSGVVATEMLFTRGRPFSAIFAANDQMAYGARLALYRRGIRVPQDVSLVGFDDQPHSAYITPPLTTIRQPAVQMGEVAAAAILHRIRGEPYTIPQFPAELIVRESTQRHP